jgi:hypothetical protein
VTTVSLLDADELESIAAAAADRGQPAAGAAVLVAAVDSERLADPRDTGMALGIAAGLLEDADDLSGSLALAERAIDAERDNGLPTDYLQIFRARLLFLLDRADEAMTELTPLRSLLTRDPDAAQTISEALLAGDRGDTAHEWLTEAVHEAQKAVPETEPLDEAGEIATAVLFALLTERHGVRHELDLPHDPLDEMAEELEAAVADNENWELSAPGLFFPRTEFDELAARLPDVARICGSTWDEHRADLERALAARSLAGVTAATQIVRGSAAEFAALVGTRAIDEAMADDLLDDYAEDLDRRGGGLPWPPARNEECWCGSGAKYKKCCLPRSRDLTA